MSFFFCLSSGRQFASRKSFIRIVDSVHFLFEALNAPSGQLLREVGDSLYSSQDLSVIGVPKLQGFHARQRAMEVGVAMNSTALREIWGAVGISVILTEQRVAVCKTYQNISSSNQDL